MIEFCAFKRPESEDEIDSLVIVQEATDSGQENIANPVQHTVLLIVLMKRIFLVSSGISFGSSFRISFRDLTKIISG